MLSVAQTLYGIRVLNLMALTQPVPHGPDRPTFILRFQKRVFTF